MQSGFSMGKSRFAMRLPGTSFERCSGGDGSNRRRTGEKREGREGAGEDRWREGFQHCDHRGGGRRSRSLDQMYGYVGRCAERAVGVGVGAVRVGMGDLHGAGNNDQKNAEQREEDSPRTRSARSEAVMTHIRPLYRRVWDACLGGRGWIETQTGRDGSRRFGPRGLPAGEDELYSPAAIRGVMRPMLSTSASWPMSITSATLLKSRDASPLTNITFSWRVAKISASLGSICDFANTS